jgi:hypothetical protein
MYGPPQRSHGMHPDCSRKSGVANPKCGGNQNQFEYRRTLSPRNQSYRYSARDIDDCLAVSGFSSIANEPLLPVWVPYLIHVNCEMRRSNPRSKITRKSPTKVADQPYSKNRAKASVGGRKAVCIYLDILNRIAFEYIYIYIIYIEHHEQSRR